MRTSLFAVLLVLAFGGSAAADDPQRVVPVSYEWVVVPCASWSDAASAMVTAAGDPYVIAVPTTNGEHKWIVLKRVVSGGYVPPPDMPWSVESFTAPFDASNRMSTLTSAHCPLFMSTTDGRSLVVYVRDPEKRTRAVRH